MRWSETATPVRMQRVAIVAPSAALRETLLLVADAGCVEVDRTEDAAPGPAARRLHRLPSAPGRPAALSDTPPDLDRLEREARLDLLAGEAQVEECAASAVHRGEAVALAGWCPADRVARLTEALAVTGSALVPLRAPRGVDPPTLLREGGALRTAFAPLVRTYGTAPYHDLDPTWPAGIVYVVMFGLMFGDAGHGALLLLAALVLRTGRPRRLARLRPAWPFLAGAGLCSMLAGVAFGEFFGPTGGLPVLWLAPLEQPERLLAAAVALGGLLLALAHVAGAVNRWREGGPARALCATSGVAGLALFLGLGAVGAGIHLRSPGFAAGGAVLLLAGLALAGLGLFGAGAGGAGGALQTAVELFDAVLRLFANTVSFSRLAAFGLTHAALGQVVWRGTLGLAGRGAWGPVAAALLFAVGTVLTFGLEVLVAGIQALRLEYYELFSRVFQNLGRPFRPWHVPIRRTEVPR
ncbi:V-type ATPase 116kDa subunit family protein [Streptomyces sp. FH025]|uniref:V-type ATPase 116kDa subunit family protein n=1 Tax=Streptomyces sp. FH025 TaxID=2815937 RepID=UPI001A9E3857|nr:V-type ATPase 116kDa subunit family protein [Streptomyces sp. FH025]MBO1414574.1 ATPase [Streptomyces sp. FH025]